MSDLPPDATPTGSSPSDPPSPGDASSAPATGPASSGTASTGSTPPGGPQSGGTQPGGSPSSGTQPGGAQQGGGPSGQPPQPPQPGQQPQPGQPGQSGGVHPGNPPGGPQQGGAWSGGPDPATAWGPVPARTVLPPPAPPATPKPVGSFRRGFGVGAGASLGAGLVLTAVGLVATLAFGFVLAALVGAAVSTGAGSTAQGPTTTTVWGDELSEHRLVSVEVTGVILGDESDGGAFGGGTYGYEVAEVIDGLEAEDADGLILELNTPGGTIYGSRAIGDAVERYQERTGHQVMAYVRGMSASGGMYAMAGVDEIVSDHGTLVGSIGVIMGPFQRFRDVTAITGSLLESGVEAPGGITEEYLTQGRGKDFGNPFRDMTQEEREVLGQGLEREYEQFVDWVSEHRGISPQTIRDDLGAFVFDPHTAIEKGLVDAVMGRDEAFRHAATMNGLDPHDTRVDRVQSTDFFSVLFGVEAADGGGTTAGGRSAGADGAPIGVLCGGSPLVLAFHGDLSAVCGR